MTLRSYDTALPRPAVITARTEESPTIFTLETAFTDGLNDVASFHPGQFNMLYHYGVGEVAISIASDPEEKSHLRHTIRAVGRVTRALQTLKVGDEIGIRGPYGRGWPLLQGLHKNVIIVTGGLGCAPAVSVINYILARRAQFGALTILQGVKHSQDFIYREKYAEWRRAPDVTVHIAADSASPGWAFGMGHVTDMIQSLSLHPETTIAMMCGPEMMMRAAVAALTAKGMREEDLYLSMERNMECGTGLCGHCQYGGLFVCKDGPVFVYPEIKTLFHEKGF